MSNFNRQENVPEAERKNHVIKECNRRSQEIWPERKGRHVQTRNEVTT